MTALETFTTWFQQNPSSYLVFAIPAAVILSWSAFMTWSVRKTMLGTDEGWSAGMSALTLSAALCMSTGIAVMVYGLLALVLSLIKVG